MFSKRLEVPFVALALGLAVPASAQTYVLTDIGPGTPENGQSCVHINASGEIAGFTSSQAFRWMPSSPNAATGTYSFLPVPNGTTSSAAYGINGSGQIVGARAYTVTAKNHKTSSVFVAVLWQPDGTCVDLGGGTPNSSANYATGINDAGEIVGIFGGPYGLWVSGNIYPLPNGQPTSINKSGQVSGFFGLATTGYLWTPTIPNGTTGTSITLPFNASQVNDLGQVVGVPSWESGGAYLFAPSVGVQSLAAGNASGINNLGQVVGPVYVWDSMHGIRYLTDTTQFTLIGAAGWSFFTAEFINDYGQIVGWGTNPADQRRIFLLTPQ